MLELADSLLIDRFDARNVRINGKEAVVVLVDGDEDQLKEFVELVREEKPENAVVEEIGVEEYKGHIRTIENYRQSLMLNQLNKIVQVGLQMLQKQDLMLDKQDKMLEKQDKMLQKQDETIKVIRDESEKTRTVLGEKIDRIGENVDRARQEVTDEIKNLEVKAKSYLDERLEKLESEVQAMKSKLGMS